ncbi:MAG: conjugal transfer protein TraF [Pseudomonadota bacterium]
MKKILLLSMTLASSQGLASTAGVNPGSSMTTGPSSNVHSIAAASNNPAMTSLLVDDDQRWRFSYFPSLGFSAEYGDVENFSDDIEELIDIIDDPSLIQDPVNEVLTRFNNALVTLGDTGYLKSTLGIGAPIPALVHRSPALNSSVGISASVLGQASLQVLDDELTYDDQNGTFATATSLYLKSGIQKSLTVSYSQPIKTTPRLRFAKKGKLYGGISAKLISLELSKQVSPLQQLEGDDVSSILRDEYDANLNESTNLALSAGLVWETGRYRLGFTLENINSPKFDYGAIGVDCADKPENTTARSSCEAAAQFIQADGRIRARETHTMHARSRVDGLVYINQNWMATAALDLAAYNDIVGFENQWMHLATIYEFENRYVPSLRVGLQKNLAGQKLSSLTFGTSLFRFLSLDVEYGLDKTTIDGSSAPRRFGIALGIEESF